MRMPFVRILPALGLVVSLAAGAQGSAPGGGDFSQGVQTDRVPTGVILVKGAWSSASDTVTPLPEGGKVGGKVYDNPYFGLTLPLPGDWTQKYEGPPPSDSGYYVLAQIQPPDAVEGTNRGTLLIAAQDMFFASTPAASPLKLVQYTRGHLQADYRIETPPASITIAKHAFVRLGYVSPAAGLHWLVLATQIRCHIVEFMFTSGNTRRVENFIATMNGVKLPAEDPPAPGSGAGAGPVCIKDYVSETTILERVDPVFTEARFNPMPVRILVDPHGKVAHVHFLSAFPDQAQAISAALAHWRFKPHVVNGQPVAVETGILFGRALRRALGRRAKQCPDLGQTGAAVGTRAQALADLPGARQSVFDDSAAKCIAAYAEARTDEGPYVFSDTRRASGE